ncbi:MAG: hypothetical protein HOH33_06590 [Verrucomicrobia bacterium]|jgi:hypothetical protein|nr:hypothetical protein [Verrucomicrobiota bacterium]
MSEKQSDNTASEMHHHRKRRKKRRRSRSQGGTKPLKESMLFFIMLTAFVLALGFCLWMIVPPLLEYLGQAAW